MREVLRGSREGATIIARPGRYDLSGMTLPPKSVVYAPDGATVVGSIAIPGPNTVIRDFTFEGGTVDPSNSRSASVGQCAPLGGTTSIKVDGATNALIINNAFHNVTGVSLRDGRSTGRRSRAIISSIAANASTSTSITTTRGDATATNRTIARAVSLKGGSTVTIREAVLQQVRLVAQQQKKMLAVLDDNLRLAESGLDSLCLAIIVANLDDELGLDPFDSGTEIPTTLREFIELYEHAAA
jgi:mRNA-degrading endonuclease toxin of MazEF toxin-antitoxin module